MMISEDYLIYQDTLKDEAQKTMLRMPLEKARSEPILLEITHGNKNGKI